MTRQQKHKERTTAKNEGRTRPKNKTSNYNSFNSKTKLNRKEKKFNNILQRNVYFSTV
jgi:hypothetical protein